MHTPRPDRLGCTFDLVQPASILKPANRACPEKLLDFFEFDKLQLFDFERFLVDHVIPRDRETLEWSKLASAHARQGVLANERLGQLSF